MKGETNGLSFCFLEYVDEPNLGWTFWKIFQRLVHMKKIFMLEDVFPSRHTVNGMILESIGWYINQYDLA